MNIKNEESNEEKEIRLIKSKAEIKALKIELEGYRRRFLKAASGTRIDRTGNFYIDPGNTACNKLLSILSEMYGDVCLGLEEVKEEKCIT